MVTVDINKLIDYMTCSYRLSFTDRPTTFDSQFSIKSFLYSSLFDYCLYLRLSKQRITVNKLNQQLNFLWNSIKDKLSISLLSSERIAIKNKLKYFVNTFSSINNVLYFDVQRHIIIDNITILYSYFTYTQEHSVKTVVKFNRIVPSLGASSSFLRVIKSLIKEDLKKTQDSLRHEVSLFRCDTADIYNPKLMGKKEMNRVMDSITQGIDNKIHVPKNDFYSCKHCLHRSNCDWKHAHDQ